MEQTTLTRATVIRAVILILLLVALACVRPLILGDAKHIALQPGTPLGGPVSQAFTTGASTALPVIGKDYELQNIHYFEAKQWVVAEIHGLSDQVTDGLIVLQLKNGVYTAALGPGSAFPSTSTENMPKDVSLYINKLGAIYDPVY